MRHAGTTLLMLILIGGFAIGQTRRTDVVSTRPPKSGALPKPSPTPEIDFEQFTKPAVSTNEGASNYNSIADDRLFGWKYRSVDIHRQLDGSLKVWVKRMPRTGQETAARESLRADGVTFDPELYAYSLWLYQIKCRDRLLQVIATADFDTEGAALAAVDRQMEAPRWKNAIPDSIGESILNAVCK